MVGNVQFHLVAEVFLHGKEVIGQACQHFCHRLDVRSPAIFVKALPSAFECFFGPHMNGNDSRRRAGIERLLHFGDDGRWPWYLPIEYRATVFGEFPVFQYRRGLARPRHASQENDLVAFRLRAIRHGTPELRGRKHGGGVVHGRVVAIAAVFRCAKLRKDFLEKIGRDIPAAMATIIRQTGAQESFRGGLDGLDDGILHSLLVGLFKFFFGDEFQRDHLFIQ